MNTAITRSILYPTFTQVKLYMVSTMFVAGNIAFPVILHQFGIAGQLFLPLYFFSLLGGLTYGWRVGVVTGLVSPIMSFFISSMPPLSILPFVIIKSVVLGGCSGFLKERLPNHNWLAGLIAVTLTQFVGVVLIYALTHKSALALADLKVGYGGLLLQLIIAPFLAQLFKTHGNQAAQRDNS